MTTQEREAPINSENIETELLLYINNETALYKLIFEEPFKVINLKGVLESNDELFVDRNLTGSIDFGQNIESISKPKLGKPQKIGKLQIAQDSTSKTWYIVDSSGNPVSPGFDTKISTADQEDVYNINLRDKSGVLAKLQPEAQKLMSKRLQRLREYLSPKEDRRGIKEIAVPESAERPYDFLAVIADDRPNEGDQTQTGITEIISDTEQNAGVITAKSSIDFLNTALRGKKGSQVDVVLIDDDYGGSNSWKFDPEEIIQLAQTLGVDFSKFTPQKIVRRDNTHYWKINDISYDPYSIPNSTNYALLLRALGYNGKIIVVSSDPPQASTFIQAADEIRSGVPDFYPGCPVDGMILKTYFRGQGLLYASEIADGKWVEKSAPEGMEINALNSLLKS